MTTWQTGYGSGVATFQTKNFGTITISTSAFQTNPGLLSISTSSANYHEYHSVYNTGISVNDLSIGVLEDRLQRQPTPFTKDFAGPGWVFSGAPSGSHSVVNVTQPWWHILDPGAVERRLIIVHGKYVVETVGIGVGALGEINTWSFFTDPVWDTAAFEGIFLRPLSDSTLDGPYQIQKYFIDRAMNYARCFTGDTAIMLSDDQTKAIRDIKVGDIVMSFDPTADGGRGALVPKRVKRLFHNTTTEWIKLTWLENGEAKELVATPGHHMLDKFGAFTRLDLLVHSDKAEVVLASGAVVEAKAEHITYSAETARLFEQAASDPQSAASGAVGLMH